MVIVVIGPMGCGKTTIGKLLAEKTGFFFDDADHFHPAENVEKMRAGTPLDDTDRIGWLEILAKRIRARIEAEESLVLACSALKQSYRDLLGIDQKSVISVYLKGSIELLQSRLGSRSHEYMNDSLLTSQIATMEEPRGGLIVDIGPGPDEICDEIITKLQLTGIT
jgi:carbohydrate kinase (thermoresistant glucokinase family)